MKQAFKKYVNGLSKVELADELLKLYTKFDLVEKYYQLELGGQTEETVHKYKAKIDKAYYPDNGYPEAQNGKSRKIVLEFAKISVFKKDLIDLWLYRSEIMIGYARNFTVDDESFYESLDVGFDQACKIIIKENMLHIFKERLQKIVASTDGLWSGCYDEIGHIYNQYFYEE